MTAALHAFPSPEWVAAYGAAINASEDYRTASTEWTHGSVALVLRGPSDLAAASVSLNENASVRLSGLQSTATRESRGRASFNNSMRLPTSSRD